MAINEIASYSDDPRREFKVSKNRGLACMHVSGFLPFSIGLSSS